MEHKIFEFVETLQDIFKCHLLPIYTILKKLRFMSLNLN